MKPYVLAALLALTPVLAVGAEPHAHPMPTEDTRAYLDLTVAERAMLLEEMHLFLGGVGRIAAALGQSDFDAVTATARPLGPQMAQIMPASLRAKLPAQFRQFAQALHGDFGQLALDAETLRDTNLTLTQLAAMLQKCSGCHRTYQIRVVDDHAGH